MRAAYKSMSAEESIMWWIKHRPRRLKPIVSISIALTLSLLATTALGEQNLNQIGCESMDAFYQYNATLRQLDPPATRWAGRLLNLITPIISPTDGVAQR